MIVQKRRSQVEVDDVLAAKLADDYQAGVETLGSICRTHGEAVRLAAREVLHSRGVETLAPNSTLPPRFPAGSHFDEENQTVYGPNGKEIGYFG